MKKKLAIIIGCILGLSAALLLWLYLRPQQPTVHPEKLKAAYDRQVQRLYRHEILSLYEPPAETFTANGNAVLRKIQQGYSKLFLPYLVMGSTLVAQDVLYNPWFDMFVMLEDTDGLVNSIVLASSLPPGETPQMKVESEFWKTLYTRYEAAKLATFSNPVPYKDLGPVILEMRNLTNNYHWPQRVSIASCSTKFDLYIQRPNQAIYCNSLEPGAYIIFNVAEGQMHTNLLALLPYGVAQMEKNLAEAAIKRNQANASDK